MNDCFFVSCLSGLYKYIYDKGGNKSTMFSFYKSVVDDDFEPKNVMFA